MDQPSLSSESPVNPHSWTAGKQPIDGCAFKPYLTCGTVQKARLLIGRDCNLHLNSTSDEDKFSQPSIIVLVHRSDVSKCHTSRRYPADEARWSLHPSCGSERRHYLAFYPRYRSLRREYRC